MQTYSMYIANVMQKHILKEQFTPFLFMSPSCCFKPVCCFCLFFLLKHKSRLFTRTITQSAHMSKNKDTIQLLHTTSIFLCGSFKRGTHQKSWNKVCDLHELLLLLCCVLLLTDRSLNCHYNKKIKVSHFVFNKSIQDWNNTRESIS